MGDLLAAHLLGYVPGVLVSEFMSDDPSQLGLIVHVSQDAPCHVHVAARHRERVDDRRVQHLEAVLVVRPLRVFGYGLTDPIDVIRQRRIIVETVRLTDILVSLFGVGTRVKSQDVDYDGVFKVKGGAEVTYLPLSWFGISERFDHVRLNGGDSKQAFTIWTSRLLFHLGWKSRGEVALQYSHFVYGSNVYVTAGYPPHIDPTLNPDRDVFSLIATYWW